MIPVLAQIVDAKTVEKAVEHVERQPMIAVVICLSGIIGVALFCVIYWIKVVRKQDRDAQVLERKERADRHSAERADRKEKEAADRRLLEIVATAGIESAGKNALATIADVNKVIGDRVAGVKDDVSAAHETSRKIERSVREIVEQLAKRGITLVFLLLGFGAGSAKPEVVARPIPAPNLCNPRCPAGQVCMGKICTAIARPPGRRPTPLKPQTSNYAVVTTSWTDGRDPFEREPE